LENVSADHVDFKKAVDLLDFVDFRGDEEDARLLRFKHEVIILHVTPNFRLHIFATAAARDDWAVMDAENPLEAVRETTFFKLAEFCYLQVRKLPLLHHQLIISFREWTCLPHCPPWRACSPPPRCHPGPRTLSWSSC